jgi:hypothetical protein
LYCLEMAKYFNPDEAEVMNQVWYCIPNELSVCSDINWV